MALTQSRKPKAYQLKARASHHRHSKSYLKPYWPYIPIIVIIAVGIGANSFLAHKSQVLGTQSNFSEVSLLNQTNHARNQNKVNSLNLNSELETAAQTKANDMVKANYWSHISPLGVTPWSLIIASGYKYQTAGENLAYGFSSSAEVTNAWLSSPEHRANLLNPSYSNVGYGVAESQNYLGKGPAVIIVAEYAQPLSTIPVSSSSNFVDASTASVSRLQLLNNTTASWVIIFATAISGALIAILAMRHAIYLRKLINEGETFILHHATLDILVIAILTFGIVFTRSAGFIG